MSNDTIVDRAEDIGDILVNRVDPKSPEQQVLKEIWQVADEEEQQAIASALIKLVSADT